MRIENFKIDNKKSEILPLELVFFINMFFLYIY